MNIGKAILYDNTEIKILEDSSEFVLSVECSSFPEIEKISKLLTIQNLKRFGLTFAEDFIDYKTYKKVSSVNVSPVDENGKYKVLFLLTDDNFLEIQMLEMQEYQVLNNSTVIATQILAQKFSDTEALTVKELYPRWSNDTDYVVDYKVLFQDTLYRCLKSHKSSNVNRPDILEDAKEKVWISIEPKTEDVSEPTNEPSGELKNSKETPESKTTVTDTLNTNV